MEQFHFGENLRTLRKARGITQEKMAAWLRMSQSSYSRLESQRALPDARLVKEIAKILEVGTAALKPPASSTAFGLVSVMDEAGFNRKMKEVMQSSAGRIVVLGAIASFVDTLFGVTRTFCARFGASEELVEWISWSVALSALVYIYYAFKSLKQVG